MTIKECYDAVGGDYETAIAVFRNEDRIRKYLRMYLEDEYYDMLCHAQKTGDIQEAFEAAHAMKGVTGMFYLTRLFQAVCALVEQLRPQNVPMDQSLFEAVKEEQEAALAAISKID